MYLQARRDEATAKRFLRRLVRSHGGDLRKIVTDKLSSYGVAHWALIPDVINSSKQCQNNRAEQSQSLPRFIGYEATRARERDMWRFKSMRQA